MLTQTIALWLVVFVFNYFGSTQVESAVHMSCQNDWILNNGQCYFFGRTKKNWSEAKAYCRGQGANLVKVDDIAEHIWLAMIMNAFGSNNMWIGANDHAREGQYRWVSDDSRVSFNEWNRNQPDDFLNNEDCAEICICPIGYHWNDHTCSSRKNFLCEK